MSSAAASRQRLDPEIRRKQILQCARRIFAKTPYQDVSTAEIAAKAGVARGLVNHYFGTKRELYLEVVRTAATVPAEALLFVPNGTLAEKVDVAVTWFLDSLERSGGTWIAATSTIGLGRDKELEKILLEAENVSVDRTIEAVGLDGYVQEREQIQAMIRSYAQLARSAGREWLLRKTLSREQVHSLMCATLLCIVTQTIPTAVVNPDKETVR